MVRHEYRLYRWAVVVGVVIGVLLAAGGLTLSIVFIQGGFAIGGLFCVPLMAVGAAICVEYIRGSVLVVTEDGMHGFRHLHRMEIPWSSVRAIAAGPQSASPFWAAVWILLDNGKQIQLNGTQGTRARAARIAGELTDLFIEHGGLAG